MCYRIVQGISLEADRAGGSGSGLARLSASVLSHAGMPSTKMGGVIGSGRGVKGWVFLAVAGLLVAGNVALVLVYDGVRARDLVFVAGFGGYLWLANAVVFQTHKMKLRPLTFMTRWWTRALFGVGLLLTLGAPWFLILRDGRPEIVKLYSPHLFLYSSQILMEFWGYRKEIPQPTRILIPLGFNFHRLGVVVNWYKEATREDSILAEEPVHRTLAIANGVFWLSVYVFVLLLVVLPAYFEPRPRRISQSDASDESIPSTNGAG